MLKLELIIHNFLCGSDDNSKRNCLISRDYPYQLSRDSGLGIPLTIRSEAFWAKHALRFLLMEDDFGVF